MLLRVLILYYISIVSANFDICQSFVKTFTGNEIPSRPLVRHTRNTKKNSEFSQDIPSCHQLMQTSSTPFVVYLLYKTSGRFLGMGSIIDRKTVLTAAQVVDHAMDAPVKLLILAGRKSPWWGANSQVRKAKEIYQIDPGLAIVIVKYEFLFNNNVSPIKISNKVVSSNVDEYGKFFAVFGLQRTGWDIPGELTPKGIIYHMKVEEVPESQDSCLHVYPDYDFNSTIMTCTNANGSWTWGCLGSPTIALDKTKQKHLLQIAVVVKTTMSDTENYHFHLSIAQFEPWIRAHSLLGYKNK